ncbi:hypothetical protein F5141DRAFT_1059201 [Pisolithus sp. B1]|nr:hypothetical protein F5141DRAFT_1059201 [Pisolithus sp. B1]
MDYGQGQSRDDSKSSYYGLPRNDGTQTSEGQQQMILNDQAAMTVREKKDWGIGSSTLFWKRLLEALPIYGRKRLTATEALPIYGRKRLTATEALPIYGWKHLTATVVLPIYGQKSTATMEVSLAQSIDELCRGGLVGQSSSWTSHGSDYQVDQRQTTINYQGSKGLKMAASVKIYGRWHRVLQASIIHGRMVQATTKKTKDKQAANGCQPWTSTEEQGQKSSKTEGFQDIWGCTPSDDYH